MSFSFDYRSDTTFVRQQSNANFVKLAKRVFKLKLQKPQLSKLDFNKKTEIILKQVQEKEPVVNKHWLEASLGRMG